MLLPHSTTAQAARAERLAAGAAAADPTADALCFLPAGVAAAVAPAAAVEAAATAVAAAAHALDSSDVTAAASSGTCPTGTSQKAAASEADTEGWHNTCARSSAAPPSLLLLLPGTLPGSTREASSSTWGTSARSCAAVEVIWHSSIASAPTEDVSPLPAAVASRAGRWGAASAWLTSSSAVKTPHTARSCVAAAAASPDPPPVAPAAQRATCHSTAVCGCGLSSSLTEYSDPCSATASSAATARSRCGEAGGAVAPPSVPAS